MASDSGQRFIKRNRPPRVQIAYEDPHDSNRRVELPFVMGVMADLSGNAGAEKPPVGERHLEQVDMDTFDELMSSKVQPGVRFAVENKLGDKGSDKLSVDLKFKSMDDFSPAAVAKNVPPLKSLLEARQQLNNLRSYMTGRVKAEDILHKLLSDPELMAAIKDRRGQAKVAALTDDTKDADEPKAGSGDE